MKVRHFTREQLRAQRLRGMLDKRIGAPDPMPRQCHGDIFRTSALLIRSLQALYKGKFMNVQPEIVIRLLKESGIKFVLMGAYATNGWSGEARATNDVDVLIAKRHHKKAVQAVRAGLPELVPEEHPAVTRFRHPETGQVVVDLMKPIEPIHHAVWKNTILIENSHDVPNLEMALAAKFAAMISPNRADDKKYIDASDFIKIVRHNRQQIERAKLQDLGELVYKGGGRDILGMVDDVLAGRKLTL